jgi:shikimate dehydrogenase
MMKQFYVIGQPIEHSMSPSMHNEWFRQHQIPATYLAKNVSPVELKETVEQFRNDVDGFNVTAPLKVDVMSYLDEIDPLAKEIGAVNTVINQNERLIGKNTDGIGFVKSLEPLLNKPITEECILIIGAGGAARAILYSLFHLGATNLTIANRSLERATSLLNEQMARKVQIQSLADAEMNLHKYSVIIQTTSIGMHPNEGLVPLSPKKIKKGTVVSDLIYNPYKTKFLIEAEKNDAIIQNGIGMFVNQGALAFEEWNGIFPNIEKATKQLEINLGGHTC